MSKNVNKLDYLKKYLSGSGNRDDNKKKKKRHKVKGTGMKIIDDDVDVSKIRQLEDDELEILGMGEDAPLVVGIIDERPEHVKIAENYSSHKWKIITQDDGINSSITVQDARNKNNSSDSDLSPVRRNNNENTKKLAGSKEDQNRVKDEKGNHKNQKDSDSDLSPVRNTKSNKTKLQGSHYDSKKREKRQNSDSDLSPARPKKTDINRHKSKSSKKQDSDSDLSPVRNKADINRKSNHSDSDLSPPRQKHKYEITNRNIQNRQKKSRWDTEDPRKRDRSRSNDRNRQESKNKHDERLSTRYNDHKYKGEVPPKLMEKTLDGKKAGLQDAKHLKDEVTELKRKESEMFSKLSEDMTGRNATTVKRNLGKRETSEDREKQKQKLEKQKELDAKYDRWGKGVKQIEEHEARVKEFLHEASKPMARYRDDKDLESSLRHRERDGDPMLEYMRRKEKERGESSGEPVRPIYRGPYPPNRFNIKPGHRWDGVDRSNGHEKNYFSTNSKRAAMEAEKYKWSTEDM